MKRENFLLKSNSSRYIFSLLRENEAWKTRGNLLRLCMVGAGKSEVLSYKKGDIGVKFNI